jgi:23S rRNA U2552 (ribose-2'-O)-methylase RlmE/FtsJ
MWELINKFDIFNDNNGINIACLAEGPGGFIEAIINYRMLKNNGYCLDNINGITLNKGKSPLWDPLIKKIGNKNINLRLGYGDLYNSKSIRTFCNNINGNIHIITADGGFNYSNDYNNQEKLSYRIIFNEVLTALTLQKRGGIFICKIFDIFHKFTVQLIYILYCLYDEIHIVKLQTSRVANSEKYLVAKGFKFINPYFLKKLYNISENWDDNIIGFKGINIPTEFIKELGKINSKYVNEQIKSINKTINFAKRTDIFYPFKDEINSIDTNNTFKKNYWNNKFKNKKKKAKNKFNKQLFNKEHIKNAIQWCIDFDMPINKNSIYLNIK